MKIARFSHEGSHRLRNRRRGRARRARGRPDVRRLRHHRGARSARQGELAARSGHPALEGGRASARTTASTPPRWAARRRRSRCCSSSRTPSVIGPGDAIVLPPQSQQVDFEGELAVVIGSIAKNVPAADAADVHLRLHGRQRRDRSRPAEDRRAVGAGQGIRHVLPARPGDRDRVRPVGRDHRAPASTAS